MSNQSTEPLYPDYISSSWMSGLAHCEKCGTDLHWQDVPLHLLDQHPSPGNVALAMDAGVIPGPNDSSAPIQRLSVSHWGKHAQAFLFLENGQSRVMAGTEYRQGRRIAKFIKPGDEQDFMTVYAAEIEAVGRHGDAQEALLDAVAAHMPDIHRLSVVGLGDLGTVIADVWNYRHKQNAEPEADNE